MTVPNFMFNMDTFPVDACYECSKAAADAHRRFFKSVKSRFQCFAFHQGCYNEQTLRFLTGRVSELSIQGSLCHYYEDEHPAVYHEKI